MALFDLNQRHMAEMITESIWSTHKTLSMNIKLIYVRAILHVLLFVIYIDNKQK